MLGAGGGGLSTTVELSRAGHDVALWNRNPDTLAPYRTAGRVPYSGVLGSGEVRPTLITSELGEALAGADAVVACLPAVAHPALFADLADLRAAAPVVLNPGQTGAALHARQVWAGRGVPLPPLVELSTLTYVARVDGDGTVHTTGRARTVRAGCLPGGDAALAWAQRLFPAAQPVVDVLASSLSNVNLVLHPPGAVLGLAWVEATGGDFTFYVDGMTPGVARVLSALDRERRAVAAAFGHTLPALVAEMAAIGTVDRGTAADGPAGDAADETAGEAADETADDAGDTAAAIRSGAANRTIRAPASTAHRYYQEDLPYGVLPFVTLAGVAGVPVPTAAALLALCGTALGDPALGDPEAGHGLGRHRLGLAGRTLQDLLAIVRP